jgi:hypothetical protein
LQALSERSIDVCWFLQAVDAPEQGLCHAKNQLAMLPGTAAGHWQ